MSEDSKTINTENENSDKKASDAEYREYLKKYAPPEKVSDEQLEFAYTNALKYMDELRVGCRAISRRAQILLLYITILIICCTNLLLFQSLELNLRILTAIFLVWNIGLLIYTLPVTKHRYSYSAYFTPDVTLSNCHIDSTRHLIIYSICLELLERTETVHNQMNIMSKRFGLALEANYFFLPRLISKVLSYFKINYYI